MFMFPFKIVPKGAKILIYGGGKVGKCFVEQIIETKHCKILAVIDKNAKNINIHQVRVIDLNSIFDFDFDFILIAVDSLSISEEIKNNLIALGIKEEKLISAAFSLYDQKVSKLLSANGRLLLDHIGGRIDSRMTRLEVLQYYSIPQNFATLSSEEKKTLHEVQNYCDLGQRVFPEDSYYEVLNPNGKIPLSYTAKNIFCDEYGFYYALINGVKMYLGIDRRAAEIILEGCWFHYERDNPHTYLMPEDDGIDIPEQAIIADIGAAEGYFGIKHMEKSSKVYFFESESEWIINLKKGLENNPKAEIINAEVGDKEHHLRLDDFFADKTPDLIKIDVEGSECSVLRGMDRLLGNENPLILLIATYHRQEDWERIEAILNPNPMHPRFSITHSRGYYWHMPDPKPPYFRRGIMRAKKYVGDS